MKKGGKNVVKEYIRDNGITEKWLAGQLGVTPQAVNDRLSKVDMETSFVRRVSEILSHNFFIDLAKTVNLGGKQYKIEPESDAIDLLVAERVEKYMKKRKTD